ncbi:MAG TPA: S41 family peptidase [Vicinamibacterales bacterium]|jgi:carboxyl-terminal processing protease|nr:S41 family peptidase [Vicinamibacterales bacterium]
MSLRTRRIVLLVTAPVIAFALVGGVLTHVLAADDPYPSLKIFSDVESLISSNYVEKVDIDKVMTGAMHGLADSLDPDSAFLTPDQVKLVDANAPMAAGDVGIDLTRQGYLRIIAVRDGSPAARAGLMTGDFVRIIGDTPTRDMSVFAGMRQLRGAIGSKVSLTIIRDSPNDPHVVELTREATPANDVSGRMVGTGVGYVRIAAIGAKTADQVKAEIGTLSKTGATSLILDVRRTSGGLLDGGLALARLFVPKGTLAFRESKGANKQTDKEAIDAVPGDGTITMPAVVLLDLGTSSAAELFASAMAGNQRADLIGEHTIGRAARQKLIKLPDGSGLWLTTTRYLMPDGKPLHEHGLEPSVAVDEPEVKFGQTAPAGDPILDKALEQLSTKKAA